MRSRIATGILVLAVVVCAVVLLLAKMQPDVFFFVGRAGSSLCKLACLMVGAVFAVRSAYAFEPGTPARRAWIAFAFFQCTWVLGQLWYCFVVIGLRAEVSVPSIADVFFISGQLATFYALFTFIEAWKSSGLVTLPRFRNPLGAVVIALLVLVVVGMFMLARHGALKHTESIVISVYPLLDCAMLWPLLVLLAMSTGMGGGRVALVWRRMLLGVLACGIGDFAYAFFAQLGVSALDPIIDLALCASYAYIAAGAVQQDAVSAA